MKDALVEYLKTEYGINSPEELRRELEKQKKLDISLFTAKKEKENDRKAVVS